MGKTFTWERDIKKAIERSTAEQKSILLDFFSPGWIGCYQMGAVTYPDLKVVEFVNETLIPIQFQADSDTAEDFTVRWTPTLVILDTNGKEHTRTIGYIAPEEFIPTMLLGIAKMHFDLRHFDAATQCLEKIMDAYPWSCAAPEAVFYHGVCGYKTSHKADPLKQAYERIAKEYPYNEWVKRALPYRLL